MSGNGQWTIEELLTLASDTAMEAGGLLLERLGEAPTRIGTKAGAGDIVTDADRDSESLIVQRLLTARPEDGIIAEERGAFPGSSGLTWVIDPLDGSANYVRGATPFGVSIAACDAIEGRRLSSLVGVVCWVGAGRIEAFYQPGLKVWDFAAAQLIVTESGASFTLTSGLQGSTETVAATVPELESEFLAALHSSGVRPLTTTLADDPRGKE
ncbi:MULTISPECIES: inositol monophosphatase family protein [Arthrobacter]|uniref:inositol-phosphate phosphatase n=1 Tax=Arthrobacter terricola TaxID=2547396 RepID=A0A4R5KG41_9MICC|nr:MULTISPECIES: inositol monophosphatase family protein [Arthrobacter]MBT8159717.1 hypothetical protein [Arthrobacter sp. GN70]TDF93665.1 hypothetical protein E1809_15655 [Arthrobacter terricola]